MSNPKVGYSEMVFMNPMNGYEETISNHAIPATFFFGPIYLAYRGAWGTAFLLVLISAPFLAMGVFGLGWLSLFFVLIFNAFFAAATPTVLAKQYLRRGWKMERAKSQGDQL